MKRLPVPDSHRGSAVVESFEAAARIGDLMSSRTFRWAVYGLGAGLVWAFLVAGWIAVRMNAINTQGALEGDALNWGITTFSLFSLPLGAVLAPLAEPMSASDGLLTFFYLFWILSFFLNWALIGLLVGWVSSRFSRRAEAPRR